MEARVSALYGDMLDAECAPKPNKESNVDAVLEVIASRVTQGTVFKRIGPSEGLLS